MIYYVHVGDGDFIDALPELTPKTDYVEVDIPAHSVEYFTRWYTKYRVVNGVPSHDMPFPDLSIDYLLKLVDKQADLLDQQRQTIARQETTLNSQNKQLNTQSAELDKAVTTITQLKALSAKAIAGQSKVQLAVDGATETIGKLQALSSMLMVKVAKLQKDLEDDGDITTNTTSSTTKKADTTTSSTTKVEKTTTSSTTAKDVKEGK